MAHVRHLIFLLPLAAFGGGLFTLVGLPAGWLAGAMTVTAIAVLAGARAEFPNPIRNLIFVVLGLQIGGSVTADTLRAMLQWPVSLGLLMATVAAVVVAGMVLFRRGFGWDGTTAFFSTMPGALSMVIMLAAEARAQMVPVAVTQTIRLFALVAIVPGIITLSRTTEAGFVPAGAAGSMGDLVIVVAGGVMFAWLFAKLRIPAGLMLGPAVANAGLHLTGVVEGGLPAWVVVPGFVLLGLMIGLRFAGVGPADLRRTGGAALAGLAVTLAVAIAGAGAASAITGIPFSLTLLAFAPGGLEAMVILAFALNLDPAYVGTHQIARFIALSLAMPLVYRLLRHHWR